MKMWQHDFNFSGKNDFIALIMPKNILLISSSTTLSYVFD